MILLAIDTATESVSVALHDGDDVVAFSETRSDRQHTEARVLLDLRGKVFESKIGELTRALKPIEIRVMKWKLCPVVGVHQIERR